jgi:hypothetical protein
MNKIEILLKINTMFANRKLNKGGRRGKGW